MPANWNSDTNYDWHIWTEPRLPLLRLRVDGTEIGWLIGFPINHDGLLTSELEFHTRSGPDEFIIRRFENEICSLTGRYVAILVFPGRESVYLDAAGSLAAVFDRSEQVVASTPNLVPNVGEKVVDHSLVEGVGVGNERDWYPFGLTPFRSVERIMPNHHLELQSWRLVRHWPAGQLPRKLCGSDAAKRIAGVTHFNIRSVAQHYPLTLSLTAGRDSRLILACARSVLDQCEFFTRGIDAKAEQDIRVAKVLSRRLGLKHRTVEFEAASLSELEDWQRRTGFCVAGRWWKSIRAVKKLEQGRMFLPGLTVEVGRGYYWQPDDTAATDIDAHELLNRLGMPILPSLLDRADAWLASLPDMDAFQLLDLLYIEQRLGGWAGPLHYGLVEDGLCMSPVSGKEAFTLMLSTPVQYRRAARLELDAIKASWPELAKFPINSPLGVKGYVYRARKRVRGMASKIKWKVKSYHNNHFA